MSRWIDFEEQRGAECWFIMLKHVYYDTLLHETAMCKAVNMWFWQVFVCRNLL